MANAKTLVFCETTENLIAQKIIVTCRRYWAKGNRWEIRHENGWWTNRHNPIYYNRFCTRQDIKDYLAKARANCGFVSFERG